MVMYILRLAARPSIPLLLVCFFYASFANGTVLNENCVVSVMNRTVQVQEDGSWTLANVPSFMGRVRARATCEFDGTTVSGQSDFFLIENNGTTVVKEIKFDQADAVPTSLAFGGQSSVILDIASADTRDLTVIASYQDGTQKDVTANDGMNYISSNSQIVSVATTGKVTPVSIGVALITARLEGVTTIRRVEVTDSGGSDRDGDGIPDEYELANGLDPADPIDAFEDQDNDGLTALEEFQTGTEVRNDDTDGDGILDGEEVQAGEDGYITNPLLTDSDGDGFSDSVEVLAGTDPGDPTDFDISSLLDSIGIAPANPTLVYNSVFTEASVQLQVTGFLTTGAEIDLTSRGLGTSYQSSDLSIFSFGSIDGEIFAGQEGSATLTVSNGGISVQSNVVVRNFDPQPLSYIDMPGFANNVDVAGDYAYVASGSQGLAVVSVADRTQPTLAAQLDTSGNANDVKVSGDYALVADGAAGMRIIDVGDPENPVEAGFFANGSGVAWDVASRGTLAYLANGGAGLSIVDFSDPANPVLVGSVATASTAKGVSVSSDGNLAVVAVGSAGIQLVDISDILNPVALGTVDTGDARDVEMGGDGYVFVADFSSSFTVVDANDPANPFIVDSVPLNNGGRLMDVAVSGRLAFGADVYFVNGVPVIGIEDPSFPAPRLIMDFSNYRDDNATGIAIDGNFVYMTAARSIQENGSTGTTRLYIGQYLALEDTAGIPPTVEIMAPTDQHTAIEGALLPVMVNATDDITVVTVELLIDDQVVATDTAAPYQFNYQVPDNTAAFTVSARAYDLAGNSSESPWIVVNVIPDPGTNVIGTVVDDGGLPVEGASVDCVGVEGVSGSDGSFSLIDVPTVNGYIQCTASLVDIPAGTALKGVSNSINPVLGGLTDVGSILLTDDVYEGAFLIVLADSLTNEAALRELGIRVQVVEAGVYLLQGGLASFPAMFSDSNGAPPQGTLMESLGRYFANPTSVESVGRTAYLAYVFGHDAHAGRGPNGYVYADQETDIGVFVRYDNYFWYGSYYPPNWVQDVTSETYIYNNTTDGVQIPWGHQSLNRSETVYTAVSREVRFYMNYGQCQLMAMSYDTPLFTQISGGELRYTETYVIPMASGFPSGQP